MKKIKETGMKILFLITACTSILAVALICIFLFANGLPAIAKVGPLKFLLGTDWTPLSNEYGIFPMIVGSIYVTAGAIVIGVPIGILCAIFMAEFCPRRLYKILKPAIELMAGIPSIVYGFFGLVVAESAIRAVPRSYYEGALALGATHERSVFKTVVPAAKSGITAGVILGIGRAIGETMAVMMVAGNQPVVPDSIFSGVRTLTTNIVMEMGYAQDLHREVLLATAVVLFLFILIINLTFSLIKRKDQ